MSLALESVHCVFPAVGGRGEREVVGKTVEQGNYVCNASFPSGGLSKKPRTAL